MTPTYKGCAHASQQMDEPQGGSAASEVDLWILLEYPNLWRSKAPKNNDLPLVIAQKLQRWKKSHAKGGARIQFIRRPQQRLPNDPLRWLFFAFPSADRPAIFGAEVNEKLLEALDLNQWLQDAAESMWGALKALPLPPAPLTQHPHPLYLVCTHGKRDRCCAVLGNPVFNALNESLTSLTSTTGPTGSQNPQKTSQIEGQTGQTTDPKGQTANIVWQTTHLGGHRFAATLIYLPEGYQYGRITPQNVPEMINAHRSARILDTEHLRGRVRYDPPTQEAARVLRAHLKCYDFDALHHLDTTPKGEKTWNVALEVKGRRYLLNVEQKTLPETKAPSCGGDLKPASYWHATMEGIH